MSESQIQNIVEGIKLYSNIYGDPWVRRGFSFPEEGNIPKHLRGYPLYKHIRSLRFKLSAQTLNEREYFVESKFGRKLESLGFVYKYYHQHSLVILNSFLIYKELYGNVSVKKNFKIPSTKYLEINGQIISNPWPYAAWGVNLGRVTQDLKIGRFKLIHDYLVEIGFEFKTKKCVNIDQVIECLNVYKEIYGDMKIKRNFVVPSDSTFPAVCHGIKLGIIVQSIRYYNAHADHHHRLAAIGFDFTVHNRQPIKISELPDSEEGTEEKL